MESFSAIGAVCQTHAQRSKQEKAVTSLVEFSHRDHVRVGNPSSYATFYDGWLDPSCAYPSSCAFAVDVLSTCVCYGSTLVLVLGG